MELLQLIHQALFLMEQLLQIHPKGECIMKISLKTFIIGLVAFYGIIVAITSFLRINQDVWAEVGMFIITKWFIIPLFSLLVGIMGSILLKNIWIVAVINFICCLFVMILLYLNMDYSTTTTTLDWVKYSLVISIITFVSSSITYFIRKV